MQALLGSAPLFNGLSDAELAPFVEQAQCQSLAAGEILFAAGDPASAIFLVISGNMCLYRLSLEGKEKVIELVQRGQTFGEAVVFLNRPYPVFAAAIDEVQLIRIPAPLLLNELRNNGDLALRMLAGLSMHLHKFVQDIHALSLSNATQRVAGYLLAFVHDDTTLQEIRLPANKATIASRLGLQPETFSRVWSRLKKQGIIEENQQAILIKSPAELSDLVDKDV